MIEVAEIAKMTIEEKLQVMELLWASITSKSQELPSPAWHEEVLNERLAKIARGEGEFLTIDQVKERLHKPPP